MKREWGEGCGVEVRKKEEKASAKKKLLFMGRLVFICENLQKARRKLRVDHIV